MGMQMLNDILSKVILEKWSPKNKEKHAACKAKVKSRSKVWPSAYASGQVVQCYYKEETEMENLKKLYEREMTSTEMASEKKLHKKIPKEPFIKQYGEEKGENVYYATTKKMAMENTDCGCDKKNTIMEAIKKSATKRKSGNPRPGSPWFRHKVTRKIIKRGDKEGRSYLDKGQQAVRAAEFEKMRAATSEEKLKKGSRYGPAKKYIEVLGACATLRAQGKPCGKKKGGISKKSIRKK